MLISLRPSCDFMGSNVNLGSFGMTIRPFSMTIRLIQVDQLQTVYLCYGVIYQSGVIWGHWGRKVICTKECYNSSMLHSMTIRLIQVDQLETLYLCYGVICQSGVIWGH